MMANENFAFGLDLSRYNTSPDGKIQVDFDRIAAHEPRVAFITMRAGISWCYQDPWFSTYFTEARRIGRARLAYHVLYPGESAQAQMDNFFRILGDANLSRTPLVLDLELDHGYSAARITAATAEACRIMQKRSGRAPVLYSRAGWVDQYLRVADLPEVHWWLAQYRWPWPYPLYTPEHPCPPALPQGVTDWLIHQTAARGASIGAEAAHYMDYNRWNGTEVDLAAFIGDEAPQTVICPLDQQVCPVHSIDLRENDERRL